MLHKLRFIKFKNLKILFKKETILILFQKVEFDHPGEQTTGELTIWLTIDDCLTATIDGSKRTNHWLQVFIANNITA